MTLSALQDKITNKESTVAIIGLGYVGLPVACMFAKAGFKTLGVDIDQARVDKINQGINPIEGIEPGLSELVQSVTETQNLTCTTDYAMLADADVITISVQTPVDSDHQPRYEHLKSALTTLGNVLTADTLVIIESTLSPGTMTGIVQPTLEASSGLQAGIDFYLGHCPERVMPGRLLHNIQMMNRVIGGLTPEIAEVMTTFYQQIVQGDLDTTDVLTAELVKTTENAYRDVQIAFANEVAQICEDVGADVWELRQLVNKSPGRNMLYPGAGVGGHCIPKDPWLLISSATHSTPSLIPTARAVNASMPQHVLHLTENALSKHDIALKDAKIVALGYAYLENSDDTRNSPSEAFVQVAWSAEAEVCIHDPYVPAYQQSLDDMVHNADALVILVAHDMYKTLDWQALLSTMRTPIIVDSRNVIDTLPASIEADFVRLGSPK
ncbi:MAG: nucleotide sugar dehydrogenase [Chloroflexota bacterium]